MDKSTMKKNKINIFQSFVTYLKHKKKLSRWWARSVILRKCISLNLSSWAAVVSAAKYNNTSFGDILKSAGWKTVSVLLPDFILCRPISDFADYILSSVDR